VPACYRNAIAGNRAVSLDRGNPEADRHPSRPTGLGSAGADYQSLGKVSLLVAFEPMEQNGAMASTCFGTAFYHSEADAPNLGRPVSDDKFGVYYRCMVVLFASVRRYFRDSDCIVFTDRPIISEVVREFEMLGVQVCVVPEGSRAFVDAKDIRSRFPGCLFTLDVLQYLRESRQDKATILLLDSDCLLLRELPATIVSPSSGRDILVHPLSYDLSNQLNGQSVASLSLMFETVYPRTRGEPLRIVRPYGGELFGCTMNSLPVVNQEVAKFWRFAKENVAVYGNEYTEEHLLSLAANRLADRVCANHGAVKRVWTAENYDNIDGTELTYPLLHLPAEKTGLFQYLYREYGTQLSRLDKVPQQEYENLVLSLFGRVVAERGRHRKSRKGLRKFVHWFRVKGHRR
jgi:hypothetical protein